MVYWKIRTASVALYEQAYYWISKTETNARGWRQNRGPCRERQYGYKREKRERYRNPLSLYSLISFFFNKKKTTISRFEINFRSLKFCQNPSTKTILNKLQLQGIFRVSDGCDFIVFKLKKGLTHCPVSFIKFQSLIKANPSLLCSLNPQSLKRWLA